MNLDDILLYLIRLGLGVDDAKPLSLTSEQWAELQRKAQAQAMVGIVFAGIEKLPKECCPETDVLLYWIGLAEQIKKCNRKVNNTLLLVDKTLTEVGISHWFMKGQTVAARYDEPLLRTSGDIDFVVLRDKFGECLKALETISKVDYELAHEHHGMAYVGDVVLEPHYKVHNYQSARNDMAFDELFKAQCSQYKAGIEIEGVTVSKFEPTFESVYLISHIVNHVYEEGVGLRQLCDWIMLLQKESSRIDWQRHTEYLKAVRMTCSFRILGYICETHLGLPSDILNLQYTASEKKNGERLFADILKGGNFGRNQYVFNYKNKWGELCNYLYVTKRAFRFYAFCPSEARMWPVAKLKRYTKKLLGFSLK